MWFDWTLGLVMIVLLILLVEGAYHLGLEDGMEKGKRAARIATEDRPATRGER